MSNSDYTTSLLVSQSPAEVFQAINNIPGWWSASFEGESDQINDIFIVRFGETYVTSKVAELIPGRKIAWEVTDCNKPWLRNKKEWVGTTMNWEISGQDNQTELQFTHFGLVPEIECFGACEGAWTQYIHQSLMSLITSGKGQPTVMKAV